MKFILIILFSTLSFVYTVNLKKEKVSNAKNCSIRDIISSKNIFQKNVYKTFFEIEKEGDAFFKDKYPNLSIEQLSQGEFKDGDFVKYQRWKYFWKNHLNADGTLGFDVSDANILGSKLEKSDYDVKWEQVNYNGHLGDQVDMGRVNCMAFHPENPNIYFLGTAYGGLWKTLDGGETYHIVNDKLPVNAISDIFIDPENPDCMVVALGDFLHFGPPSVGIYKSIDGGETFAPTGVVFSMKDFVRIRQISVSPKNNQEFYIATSKGLLKTTDYFETYKIVYEGDFSSVKCNSEAGYIYAGGTGGNCFISGDKGETFRLIKEVLGEVRIAVSDKDNGRYIAITSGDNILTSKDYGHTFTEKKMPESNCPVSFVSNSTDLVVGNFRCFISDNNGDTFTVISDWLEDNKEEYHDVIDEVDIYRNIPDLPVVHVDQRNIYTNKQQPDFVYFCNDGGIFRYSISENKFTNLSKGLFITQYYDIAVSQIDNVLAGGSQDNACVIMNNDGSWASYAPTGDGMIQQIDYTDSDIRYYSIQFGFLSVWNKKTKQGNFIRPQNAKKGAWITPYEMCPQDPNRLIAGYHDVYETENGGLKWKKISKNISSKPLEQIAISKSNPKKIYASVDKTLYAKHLEKSKKWKRYNPPIDQPITDLKVHPENENIVYISCGGFTEGSKVFRSVDGGKKWENISYNLDNVPVMSLETYNNIEGSIFIGSYNGVYFLDTDATEWKKYGTLPRTSVTDIEIQYFENEPKIVIGTFGRGMFEASVVL